MAYLGAKVKHYSVLLHTFSTNCLPND